MNKVDVEYLKDLFELDIDKGQLIWKTRPIDHFSSSRTAKMWNKRFAGKEAGSIDGAGYVVVCIDSIYFRAHRVVWAYTFNKWPEGPLDHINGNRQDNRPDNLREATEQQNMFNKTAAYNGTSKFKGVYWCSTRGKWGSVIRKDNKGRTLGFFNNEIEAAEVYDKAAREYFKEFARTNF